MTIIAGSRLPDNKHIVIGLTHVHGIGRSRAKDICELAKINPETKVKDLGDQVEKIRNVISEKNYVLGTSLKRVVNQCIKDKITIRSYQGRRLILGLPVNGQKTQKNAKTARKRRVSRRKD
ncbi:ribosomal protein uS13 [Candidatus Comchoanobacter bicostacola]|uniref:30S ribosomal protein S13 n=1 Tax=Candidatus Comchoanobacter bicostacola TaxID=2919598 RepID=A0ABY5DKD4_9GAMM|nr:ribosomal protein uS13 [Candidatus Comchoanobacter bicostacola]UTC24277.1 ribosomal protein uS13 [Candidatus Comchoanobacter bicostacola]